MKIVLLDSGMGVFSFVKEILIQNKKNHYILYLDEKNFPYGNKSHEEIFLIYKSLINKTKEFSPNMIYLACNTLSTVKEEDPIIKDVLSYNIKSNTKNSYFISTYQTSLYLKNKGINNVIYLKDLAYLIETNNIKKIIQLIKKTRFPNSIILTCTHYPLIKNLFIRYTTSEVLSFENKIVEEFPSEKELIIDIYTNKKEKYQNYFSNLNINFIRPS